MSIDISGDAYSLPKRSDRRRADKEHTRTWADDVSALEGTASTGVAEGEGLDGSGVEEVEKDGSIYRIRRGVGKRVEREQAKASGKALIRDRWGVWK